MFSCDVDVQLSHQRLESCLDGLEVFIIIFIIMIHLFFLHEIESKNPIGINRNFYKIPFNIYFTFKNIFGLILLFIIFIFIDPQYSYIFRDPDNFIEANPYSHLS